jgi:hypothetical protein
MTGAGVTLFTVDMKRPNTEAADGSQPWLGAGVGSEVKTIQGRHHERDHKPRRCWTRTCGPLAKTVWCMALRRHPAPQAAAGPPPAERSCVPEPGCPRSAVLRCDRLQGDGHFIHKACQTMRWVRRPVCATTSIHIEVVSVCVGKYLILSQKDLL